MVPSRILVFPVLLGLVAGCGDDAAADKRPVYRVEAVHAVAVGEGGARRVRIEVAGTVRTGGWQDADLRLVETPDATVLVLKLVATPPPQGSMVTQALTPVRAVREIVPAPGYRRVEIRAQANRMRADLP